ncbi:MFS transporter [uncultured Alsobacter sp.]|uniref:MFS transporter n=1 Tax=uncultured Alsobacter sp. TaxID=1748258 RepID=UPI0025F8EC47|nr:MFS transporter [uncultured Alsobacter sp.]
MTSSPKVAGFDLRILPILVIVFFVTIGMGMMIPVLPLFAERHGGGAAASGLLLSAFGAARLIVNVPAGSASERFGRRAVMAAGLALLTVTSFAAALVDSIPALAACLFLNGAGSSLYVTAALASVADIATPANRGRLMGYYQAGLLAGISLGPGAGGVLADLFGPTGPFIAQGTVIAAGGFPALLLLKETRRLQEGPGSASGPRPGVLAILRHAPFAAVCALMFGAYFGRVVSNWQMVPIMARDLFHYGPSTVGLLLTTGAVGQFIALPSVSLAIDKWGAWPSTVAGALLSIAAVVFMGLWLKAPALWIGVFLLGASGSVLTTACSAFAIEQSSGPNGVTMGALRAAGDFGLVLGPLIVGVVVTGTGIANDTSLLLVGLVMAIILAVFLGLTRDRAAKPTAG